ncbi:hypothetical protein GCM10020001_004090 [Nonomuraea salmonea]
MRRPPTSGTHRGGTSPQGFTSPIVSRAASSLTTLRPMMYADSPAGMGGRPATYPMGSPVTRATRHSPDGKVTRAIACAARAAQCGTGRIAVEVMVMRTGSWARSGWRLPLPGEHGRPGGGGR